MIMYNLKLSPITLGKDLSRPIRFKNIIRGIRLARTTPGEFINRYLPEDFFYRSRFSYILQTRFIDSTSYWAEEFFTKYEKFAMEEVDKLKTSSKDIRTEQLSNGGEIIPTNKLMSAYLQWAKQYHICNDLLRDFILCHMNPLNPVHSISWRPSFFHFKFGDPKLKNSFIKYLYKKASRLGLTKEQAYFRGKFQWEYSSFLKEREKANFAKKIYYKFQDWKYDSHQAWIAFKHKVLKLGSQSRAPFSSRLQSKVQTQARFEVVVSGRPH
ncbi:uncharacterized protein MELLADRAFT_109073 [Melampsora larici-populina 98AG31]|uniref:Uncharacterized protein n=1 Tax=Melampsora larici-populina (strain 98AG31 / pathotype 3-4-7) TaxID=747676 RepID=F4RV86_MELLP|nr:uncharacterized protein MELLADRAFT_109073 [Melampsora larici-populina 98AG31]EGG03579.1 hypothetical protein MELLADRAFT_109073 [Melampsora larici-populina 98AG31]